jgi:CMP-N-acetylneuraminic acid synthetase
MVNIAIITAKGGNTTLENKNIKEICGKPSIYYSISAALEAETIDEVFVSTECPLITKVAKEAGAKIIERPNDLSQPLSNHGDVIVHGAKAAREILEQEIGTITVLLGNTVMVTAKDIDNAVNTTLSSEENDSCMTVWKAQDDHPFRAMVIGEDGFLKPFLDNKNTDTNRQSYPDVFFYDQGPWTVRYNSLMRSEETHEGPGPWWWMGKNCVPVERLWVTGRDTHTQYDIDIAEWWLKKYRLAGVENPPNAEFYKNK